MAVAMAAVSLAMTAYGAYKQHQAAKDAASVDTAIGDYNAKVDIAQAEQLQLDTLQNIQTQRENNAVYLSQQHAAYASAGVLADSGSPLAAQITNAGRMEMQLQQEYANSQQRQKQLYSSASIGRLEGYARAESDKAQGTIALINGGANLAGQFYSAYNNGTFSGNSKQIGPSKVDYSSV